MATEQEIQIAQSLYAARRSLRRLLGDQYGQRIPRWMDLLRNFQAAQNLETLPALMEMLRSAPDEFAAIWLMAAAVELVEPDEETP